VACFELTAAMYSGDVIIRVSARLLSSHVCLFVAFFGVGNIIRKLVDGLGLIATIYLAGP